MLGEILTLNKFAGSLAVGCGLYYLSKIANKNSFLAYCSSVFNVQASDDLGAQTEEHCVACGRVIKRYGVVGVYTVQRSWCQRCYRRSCFDIHNRCELVDYVLKNGRPRSISQQCAQRNRIRHMLSRYNSVSHNQTENGGPNQFSEMSLARRAPNGERSRRMRHGASHTAGSEFEARSLHPPSLHFPQPTRKVFDVQIGKVQYDVRETVEMKNIQKYFSIGTDALYSLENQAALTPSFHGYMMWLYRVFCKLFGSDIDINARPLIQPIDIKNKIDVYLDHRLIRLPHLESLVFIVVNYERNGRDVDDDTSSMVMLEMLGITAKSNTLNMISEPVYLGSVRKVELHLKEKCPLMMDGKPWMQNPTSLYIKARRIKRS